MVRKPTTIIEKANKHSEAMDFRCHGVTRSGNRCRHLSIAGSRYCQIHTPAIETEHSDDERGRYTGYVGALEEKYQSALQDRYLLHVRDEIAILDARLKDLLKQAKEGVNAAAWKKFSAQYKVLKSSLENKNFSALESILKTMDDAMEEGRRENELWADIQGTMEQRRKLVETEQKYLSQTNQMIPLEAAIVLLSGTITAIKNSLKKYVADRQIEETIVLDAQREYERLIGA